MERTNLIRPVIPLYEGESQDLPVTGLAKAAIGQIQAAAPAGERSDGPASQLPPVDCVFGTAVLSTNRMLAVFYWAQSRGHNKPLILLDFSSEPLSAESWSIIRLRLIDHQRERRARAGRPLGLWVEGESLVAQAFAADIDARPIPPHLVRTDLWHSICQSAASFLSQRAVGYTARAAESMESRPFLNAAGVYAGPRTEDPLVPAFLYGIVLGLDEVLSRDPHPRPPTRGRGQG